MRYALALDCFSFTFGCKLRADALNRFFTTRMLTRKCAKRHLPKMYGIEKSENIMPGLGNQETTKRTKPGNVSKTLSKRFGVKE